MGFMGSERMKRFLEGLLKSYRFEDMRIPLGVVATDLCTGEAVSFRDTGDVFLPIRASCSYPGLFLPVRESGRLLVDGGMSMEVPAALLRRMDWKRLGVVHELFPGVATLVTGRAKLTWLTIKPGTYLWPVELRDL